MHRSIRFLARVGMLGGIVALPAVAQQPDTDSDGVPDSADNCPTDPNPPNAQGLQDPVCGLAVQGDRSPYVFLKSRVFLPPTGLDPNLICVGATERVLLHVERMGVPGEVLSAEDRTTLNGLGVEIDEYLPFDTFLATVPCTPAQQLQIVGLPFVQGISRLYPEDRLPQVTQQMGFLEGIQPDGSVDVEVLFFEDVTSSEADAVLDAHGFSTVFVDEQVRIVNLGGVSDALLLAGEDAVSWIDERAGTGEPDADDDVQRYTTGVYAAESVIPSPGISLTVGMSEGNHPNAHPDLPLHTPANGSDSKNHGTMVGGILVGSGGMDWNNRGLLPYASLVSYGRTNMSTKKTLWHGFPKKTRNQYAAVVHNMSWTDYPKCKQGVVPTPPIYASPSRYIDKAAWAHGQIVFKSAGNDGNWTGSYGCAAQNYGDIGQAAGKNPIMVSQTFPNGTNRDSSGSGPSDDGRMLVTIQAPNLPNVPGFCDGFPGYCISGGTSASAPFVAGVGGMVVQAMRDGPMGALPLDIPPHTVKSILLNTAWDRGPVGPDHTNGFGTVQADRAVGLVTEFPGNVIEDDVDAGLSDAHFFNVNSPVYSMNVLLSWTDKQAAPNAALALKNDLDIWIEDPSGNVYQPWQVPAPAGLGHGPALDAAAGVPASPCVGAAVDPACRDTVNTVEQITLGDGSAPLDMVGSWTIHVEGTTVVNGPIDYTVVREPACPITIRNDVTLDRDLSCPEGPLTDAVVRIEADDVVFDCDGHFIRPSGSLGTGTHIGIEILGDNVTVQNCQIEHFDIGIHVRGKGATLMANEVRLGESDGGAGILATNSTNLSAANNNINLTNLATGIELTDGNNALLWLNTISNVGEGIRLGTVRSGDSVQDAEIIANTIEFPLVAGVVLNGDVQRALVDTNTMTHFPVAVVVSSDGTKRPSANTIKDNGITGAIGNEVGVSLDGADQTTVADTFQDLSTAITETGSCGSIHWTNVISDVDIGIRSDERDTSCGLRTQIRSNQIYQVNTGVEIVGFGPSDTTMNLISGADIGISIADVVTTVVNDTFVEYNSPLTMNAGGTCISVSNTSGVDVRGNTCDAGATGISVSGGLLHEIDDNDVSNIAAGIQVGGASGVDVTSNTVAASSLGISVGGGNIVKIAENVVDATMVGIGIGGGDDYWVDANTVAAGPSGVAIDVGDPLANPAVTDVRLSGNTVDAGQSGARINDGVVDLEFESNTIQNTGTGFAGGTALSLVVDVFTGNQFLLNGMHAVMPAPTEVCGNEWGDVGGYDIIDHVGLDDDNGDCGSDWPYTASVWGGAPTAAANTSPLVHELVDTGPVVTTNGTCVDDFGECPQ